MTNQLLRSFNQLDSNFVKSYNSKTGFWYTFKRSVNDLSNLWLIFNVFKNFQDEDWNRSQKEFSSILVSDKLLNPKTKEIVGSANARGIKKVFEQLGFCYIDNDGRLKITECGYEFLKASDNSEMLRIKTQQLLKYQINNPIIKSNNFSLMQIKPFVFLLKLLLRISNNSISADEYRLFVSRSYSLTEMEDVVEQINFWRKINEDEKEKIFNKIKDSTRTNRGATIYEKISGYSGYGMEFYGNSDFTKVAEINDERFIFLKFNKIDEVKDVLKDEDLLRYRFDLIDNESFMNFYGHINSEELKNDHNKKDIKEQVFKIKQKITSENLFLNKKITDLFELTGRTLIALEKEKIIYLDDLLTWDEKNLRQMRGFGMASIKEIKDELNKLNKRYDLNLNFSHYNKSPNKIHTTNLDKEKSFNFSNLNEEDQLNFFMPVQFIFDNARTLNVLKKKKLINAGDLHQNINFLLYSANFGKKSMDLVKNTLTNHISLPRDIIVEDWEIIKKEKFNEFNKKISSKIAQKNFDDFKNIKYLDEEIDIILRKVDFKRVDVIKNHLGLDGSDLKTLQQTGDHFKVTRERVRQIEKEFFKKLKKTPINNLNILNKINDTLIQLCPISSTEFEKYLLDNGIVKRRFFTKSILSLIKIFIKKDSFLKINIPNYSIANNNFIIDLKTNLKYSKIIKFISKNFNSYGLINITLISKKYNLPSTAIIKFLRYQKDIKLLDSKYIYDDDKSRNRLYNSLQKIFNVNQTINKFNLDKSLSRVARLSGAPKFEIISKYCEKELDAKIDDFTITVPKNKIDKFFYNSRREIFSNIEIAIINCFNDKDKILSYSELTNRLIDRHIPANSAAVYVSRNTPIIIKVAPSCYCLVGTFFVPGEIDHYYDLIRKQNKSSTNTDYDYGDDQTIWIGYEINKKNRDGRNFSVPKSLYENIKGEYKVIGIDHTINVMNHSINRVSNEKLKDRMVLGQEIMFTFNKGKKVVEISNGIGLMKNKYN